jgi:hypothetical protein
MADIIGSSKKSSKKLKQSFTRITEDIAKKHTKLFLSPLTITLGDEFQSIVKSLKDAVTIILEIEELKVRLGYDFQLRYIVHYGKVDTPINRKIAHGMLGKGLTDARKLLTGLKGYSKNRVLISIPDKKKEELLTDCFLIYCSYVDTWSAKDFKTISLFLDLVDYKEVAKKQKRDPSLLWRKEKSIFMKEYLTAKKIIHQLL